MVSTVSSKDNRNFRAFDVNHTGLSDVRKDDRRLRYQYHASSSLESGSGKVGQLLPPPVGTTYQVPGTEPCQQAIRTVPGTSPLVLTYYRMLLLYTFSTVLPAAKVFFGNRFCRIERFAKSSLLYGLLQESYIIQSCLIFTVTIQYNAIHYSTALYCTVLQCTQRTLVDQ